MTITNSIVSRLGLTLLGCLGIAIAQANDLHIGDAAPRLKVDRWMKGKPVQQFEKGKIYVVEFWATWCGPCRMAMPHLSELAKKYGNQATFIGVDIWEDEHSTAGENLKAKANKFVKEMGDRMGYNVCAESSDGFMTTNWMHAAGQDGIPATFVIGKDSKIDWIGHPDYLADVLAKIVDGKFDVKAFAATENPTIDKELASKTTYHAVVEPIETALKEAVKAKDYDLALKDCEKGLSTAPDINRYSFAMQKFQLLAEHRPQRAYSEAVRIKADPAQIWMASETFASTPGLDGECYSFALDFFHKKYDDQPKNPNGNAHFADVYFQMGDPDKAVEYYQKFIDGVTPLKLDPVTLAGFQKQLQKFKDAATAKKSSGT